MCEPWDPARPNWDLRGAGSPKNVQRPWRTCRADSVLGRFSLRVGSSLLPGFLPPLPINNVKYVEQGEDVTVHLTSLMFSFIGTDNKMTTHKGPKPPFLCDKSRF